MFCNLQQEDRWRSMEKPPMQKIVENPWKSLWKRQRSAWKVWKKLWKTLWSALPLVMRLKKRQHFLLTFASSGEFTTAFPTPHYFTQAVALPQPLPQVYHDFSHSTIDFPTASSGDAPPLWGRENPSRFSLGRSIYLRVKGDFNGDRLIPSGGWCNRHKKIPANTGSINWSKTAPAPVHFPLDAEGLIWYWNHEISPKGGERMSRQFVYYIVNLYGPYICDILAKYLAIH